jgi:phosphoribosylformylglycinamidine synthase
VILRYADKEGRIVPDANPNGSIENIAGICNRERNVFGLMPHPDRASDARLGSADGAKIFRSMIQTIASRAGVDAAPSPRFLAPKRDEGVASTIVA